MKGRKRERENVYSNVRASEREEIQGKGTRAVSKREKEKERKEEAEKEIPVPTEWESNTFLRRSSFSIRARSFSYLSSSPSRPPFSYVLLRALLLHFVGPHEGIFGVLTLSA